MRGERASGEHQPGAFLRRRISRELAGAVDPRDGLRDRRCRRAPFRSERHQGRRIAQRRAEIHSADVERRLRRDRVERRQIDRIGARLVTEHRQRGGDLRLGDRRRQIVQLGVGDITQIADRSRAVARQHIERIAEFSASVLARLRRRGDEIAQAIDGQLEGRRRHLEFLLARACQEVGDIGIQPRIVAADRPQAERSVAALPRGETRDGVLDARVDLAVGGKPRLCRKLVDIEHRHRAAGDLLGAAERISVEFIEQGGDIERGRQANRQADAAGARHEIGEQVRG